MGLNADFEKLDINGKFVEDWFDRFDLYCQTNTSIDATNKTAYLLTSAGGQAYKLVKDLAFPKKPETLTATEIRTLICNYATPHTFEVAERSKFNSMYRRPEQSIRNFLLELQRQASLCNFGAALEEHLRDRLVAGINNNEIKKKLLMQATLDYSTAKQICESFADITAVVSQNDEGSVVHKVNISSNFRSKSGFQSTKSQERKPRIGKCVSCGDMHDRSSCKFRNAQCRNCMKTGHISKVCKTKISPQSPVSPKSCYSCGGKNHARSECRFRNAKCYSCSKTGHISKMCKATLFVTEETDQTTNEDFVLYSSPTHNTHMKKHFAISDNETSATKDIEFILDTGSPHSFISIEELYCFKNPIRPSSKKVKGITGNELKIYGETELLIDHSHKATFLICDNLNILGLSDTLQLHPAVENALLHAHVETNEETVSTLIETVSNNTGGLKIPPIHIDSDNNNPKFLKSRPLPYGLREPVKQNLLKLEQAGIIEKINSSRWATPIVCPIKSDGSV